MRYKIKKKCISRVLKPKTVSRTKDALLKHTKEQKISFFAGNVVVPSLWKFLKNTHVLVPHSKIHTIWA